MKQSRFYILFFFVVCIGLFCSCLSNDDDAQWSKFNGVYVTVGGDNIRGYKLYTDFGAILVPTEESLNRIPWLKEVQRAIVSFNLLDENENTTQLEDGKTYDVILNSTNGMNQQIPTFTVHVDTLSEEYQIFGQDSIQLKNKSIYSLDKTAGASTSRPSTPTTSASSSAGSLKSSRTTSRPITSSAPSPSCSSP